MPEIAARYVGEILGGMPEAGTYTQSAYQTIEFEGRPQLLSIDQFSRESAEALFRTADMM
jgi:aspartate carbamoyltransferase catalytic subunit